MYINNFHWVENAKVICSDPDEAVHNCITSRTGFVGSFLRYHEALQFRVYLSSTAMSWVQKHELWASDHEHA